MAKRKRWKAEQREQEWWITDGRESFRMFNRFIAEMLTSYLNEASR